MPKIYYYTRKYPEYPIESMKIVDTLYVVGKDMKYEYALISHFDIDNKSKTEYERYYYVHEYEPGIFIHENFLHNEVAMSYDKKKLLSLYQADRARVKMDLIARLERFERDDLNA